MNSSQFTAKILLGCAVPVEAPPRFLYVSPPVSIPLRQQRGQIQQGVAAQDVQESVQDEAHGRSPSGKDLFLYRRWAWSFRGFIVSPLIWSVCRCVIYNISDSVRSSQVIQIPLSDIRIPSHPHFIILIQLFFCCIKLWKDLKKPPTKLTVAIYQFGVK